MEQPLNVRIRDVLAGLSLLACAPSLASAQIELFGNWHDLTPTGPATIELYVSPGGNDINGEASGINNPGAPFLTISGALSFALDAMTINGGTGLDGVLPVTINVFPGNYVAGAAGAGEIFPLRIPTHGISLESIGVMNVLLNPTEIIGSGPTSSQNATIFVDEYGNPAFPDSVIRGLGIRPLGGAGIVIAPGVTEPTDTAIEIRDNFIHGTQCQAGVLWEPGVTDVCQDILEGNIIVTEAPQGGVLGVSIDSPGVVTAILMRSNQVARFETNVEISGSAENCRPRLTSNLIQVAERNVVVNGAHPILIHNTIAWAFNYTTQPAVYGILGNGMVDLLNNLLWNPVAGSGAGQADDIGPGVIVVQFLANVVEDIAPTPLPNFVQGNNNPGLFVALGARPPCADIHLSLGSPMIDMGSTQAIVNANGSIPSVAIQGVPVRLDVNLDVDYDPRALFSPAAVGGPILPDVGGDEVAGVLRLERTGVTAPALPVDVFGSLRASTVSGGNMDHLTALQLTTPTVAGNTYACFLFYCVGYDATRMTPSGLAFNRATHENSLFAGLGPVLQIALDLAGGFSLSIGSGSITGGGVLPMTVDPALIPLALDEADGYIQGLVIETDAAGGLVSLRMTNRTYLELNQ